MFIINKKFALTILCLLMVLTGCTAQNSMDKKSQIALLKPNEVIEQYFKYYNEKNLQGINSLSTERTQSTSEKGWDFDNLEYIKVINIVEDTNQAEKEIHIRNIIHGTEKNYIIDMDKEKLELENIIIFKVEFEVKYKKDEIGFRTSGRDNFNYILTRKDKNSPWLIDGAGH